MIYNVNKTISLKKFRLASTPHLLETGHARVDINNIENLGKNFTNCCKRKISEALYIKSIKAGLNIN